jgi:hypothetical protein
MLRILLSTFTTILSSSALLFGQYITINSFFSPTGVSDQGLVAGYTAQAGPYQIWNPDSATIVDIGGVAPGQGVGGQARFSAGGNFISGTSVGSTVPELSRYSLLTQQWTTLGSLGFMVDSNLSGGFGISYDGNTVVGNSWADTTGGFAYTHAIAYNATEGIMDLGSLFSDSGRSTRANAVNGDGSVVVGWQDYNGPWKSAVWRKNPNGGYYSNEYILIDTTQNPNDEYNQLGECSSVSEDGNWIGGYGDYANNNEPWIWNQDTGVINLGALPLTGNGYVSGMSADASVVVGWFDGQLWGDPQTPFIWTQTSGLQELNSYINNVLGFATGSKHAWAAYGISANGQYITGFGVDTITFDIFDFRVDLGPTGVKEIPNSSALKVYPNPSSGKIILENSGDALLTIRGFDGREIKNMEVSDRAEVDISSLSPGIYFLSLQSEEKFQTCRIIKE